jgi:hypothetical protein
VPCVNRFLPASDDASCAIQSQEGKVFRRDRRILEVTGVRWAGESALARMTMVNEPQQQVLAIAVEAAQRARQAGIFFEPRQIADGFAVPVWRYEPCMQAKEKTVDPLSLWLSLRETRDDRIRMRLSVAPRFP